MSIFQSIMSSILGSPAAASPAPVAHQLTGSAVPAGSTPAATAPPGAQVDVASVMDALADKSDEDLDWRKSIVDLMKLLKLDSSLAARRQLAQELRYAGDTKDTAAMNIWLHKQVMMKLAENGGQVPSDLKH
jgi:uncharacterized protein DUF3597